MAKLMGDGEGSTESVVLTDAAAPVWITHSTQLCKAWRAAVDTSLVYIYHQCHPVCPVYMGIILISTLKYHWKQWLTPPLVVLGF